MKTNEIQIMNVNKDSISFRYNGIDRVINDIQPEWEKEPIYKGAKIIGYYDKCIEPYTMTETEQKEYCIENYNESEIEIE